MQKFEIHPPTWLIWLNLFIINTSLLALYFWRAPLSYRLSAMTLILIGGLIHCCYLKKKHKHQYPILFIYKNDHWQLNEQAVKLKSSSVLTPYYAAIHTRTLTGRNYHFMITPANFKDQKQYYDFIRIAKTHQESF